MAETAVLTLTDFLQVRNNEDEANIRDDDWASGDGGLHVITTQWRERLLAECEARRKIVKLHTPMAPPFWACPTCLSDRRDYPETWEPDNAPCATLRALAAVYADHPDYSPDWRL